MNDHAAALEYLDDRIVRMHDPDLVSHAPHERKPLVWEPPPVITADEWARSVLTPRPIVPFYIYADVGLLVGPGGAGKTTLVLWETVHVALGRSLYGREARPGGVVVIVTAEDLREQLVARLRLICRELNLSPDEIAIVMRNVRISDVSGQGLKLTTVVDEAVIPSPVVDVIIAKLEPLHPILVVFDPAVSFGIGEARINDAEQGLIEAARRIRNALGCAVRFSAHTGKAVAREKILDQYAGRGGSALADGSRMVAVLQPMGEEEWRDATGVSLREGETGMVLALPKLSYCPPQPDILISRKGYAFTYTTRAAIDRTAALAANCNQILQFLNEELARGRRHTKATIEAMKLMPRLDFRDAISILLAHNRVTVTKSTQKGGAQNYLQPQQASPE